MSHGQSCITGAAPPDFPPGWAEFILARRQFLLARALDAPQPSPTPEIAEADVAAALARGNDPLRTDAPGEAGSGRAKTKDPGRRTMSGTAADQDGELHESLERPRTGVRRYDW